MDTFYRVSYDHNVVPLSHELVQANPSGAWKIVKMHLEKEVSEGHSGLVSWLKGGFPGFDEKNPRGPIADMPVQEIITWIKEAPEKRAKLIAHAVPASLDEQQGGDLTREILHRYGNMDGVQQGVSATFHSGGYSGPTSAYLRRKRDKLRQWLAAGFEIEVTQWIEKEIEYLDRNIEREEIDEERERFD